MFKKQIGIVVVAMLEFVARMCENLWAVQDWLEGQPGDPNWFAWVGEDVIMRANEVALWAGLISITPYQTASDMLDNLFPDFVAKPMGTSGSLMTDMMYQVMASNDLSLVDRFDMANYVRNTMFASLKELNVKEGIMMQPSDAWRWLNTSYFSARANELIETVFMLYGWLRPCTDFVSLVMFYETRESEHLTGVHTWCPTHGYTKINDHMQSMLDTCAECRDEEMEALYGFDREDVLVPDYYGTVEAEVLPSVYCIDCGVYVGSEGDACSHCKFMKVTENLKFDGEDDTEPSTIDTTDDESQYTPRA